MGSRYKTGEVVDMAVGIIAHDPFAEPEDFFHAEIFAEVGVDSAWTVPGCGLD